MAVVGDIHGAIDPLCAATGWLEEHWDGPVVFVGDYVNRGPDSYRVMEAMVQLAKSWGERLTLLMGNHDLSLLRFVAEGDRPMFLAHGGLRTVSSYLRELSIPLDQHPLEAFVEVFPESHRQLLEGMQLAWENSEVPVTHAGFNPISPDSRSIDDIVLRPPSCSILRVASDSTTACCMRPLRAEDGKALRIRSIHMSGLGLW